MTALEPLIGMTETAQLLGVPLQTLKRWRKYRQGPPSYRLGKHVKFRASEVEAWVQEQREAS